MFITFTWQKSCLYLRILVLVSSYLDIYLYRFICIQCGNSLVLFLLYVLFMFRQRFLQSSTIELYMNQFNNNINIIIKLFKTFIDWFTYDTTNIKLANIKPFISNYEIKFHELKIECTTYSLYDTKWRAKIPNDLNW